MNRSTVQYYEVVPGRLLAGEYPGAWNERLAVRRLETLIDSGVQTFVNLTTQHDRLRPYSRLLPDLSPDLRHWSFPIPDMGVPDDPDVMRRILRTIGEEMEMGRACYVHCWGGIGRTGTVVGCHLREMGLGPDEALAEVQRLYATGMPKVAQHPHSPQTRVQWDYVRRWRDACP